MVGCLLSIVFGICYMLEKAWLKNLRCWSGLKIAMVEVSCFSIWSCIEICLASDIWRFSSVVMLRLMLVTVLGKSLIGASVILMV